MWQEIWMDLVVWMSWGECWVIFLHGLMVSILVNKHGHVEIVVIFVCWGLLVMSYFKG